MDNEDAFTEEAPHRPEGTALSRKTVEVARDDDAGATLRAIAGHLCTDRLRRAGHPHIDRPIAHSHPAGNRDDFGRSTSSAGEPVLGERDQAACTERSQRCRTSRAGDAISVLACLGEGKRMLITDNVGTIVDAFNSVPLAPPGQSQAGTCPLLRQGQHGADVFFFGYRQREAVVVRVELGCGFVSNGRRSGRIDDEMLLSIRRLVDPLMQG
jgi:hypothetical protein